MFPRFTKEGPKALIKCWAQVPLNQRKDSTNISIPLYEENDNQVLMAVLESLPNWVMEVRSEGNGDFNNILGEFVSEIKQGRKTFKLTVSEGCKELVISFDV